ncbi:MAG TPA: IPT/TIG domain-containing protein, partial [Solirubrobacteraceae bacterium]|nr:IPT/TIG domain-containing protein [Solirubrobacteraceae bacterium]
IVGVSAGDEFSLAIGPPGPIITRLKPTSGPLGGGTKVTITGYHFIGVTEVKFGSAEAESIEVKGQTEIVATAPPGSGKACVAVRTSMGSIPVSNCKTFTYAKSGGPEYGRCVEMTKGKYSNAACTIGSAEGSYEWEPGVEKTGFTIASSATPVTLETVGKETIACKVGGGSGQYSSPKSVESTVIKLTGCTHLGAKCTSAGASEGELVTSALEGELGWISKASKTVGLALNPEAGDFAEAKCGSTKVEISGSFIGNARTNEMLKEGVLTFEQKTGKQKPTKLEGGEKDVLETLFTGGLLEQTGLEATVKQVNEEKIEVNTEV